MTFGQENTPGTASRGIPIQCKPECLSIDSDSSVADSADRGDVFGQMLNGIYIVVAEIKSPGPEQRFRRRFYAQLASAQLAVDRARMNGKDAYLYIGQVSIVGGDSHE